ncbi:hypothetical protein [Xenorhabdus cabanillasii]|uniref:Uncharacterized protein n=1 Tax=Xenorhabdus cabanillasii JM26 TaxID=1427517 RepID=W1INY5_9GAMM|nr:hypothetical protein [Xenorhabdus cabanillasii]PHM76039.1 hypothetical protein Xcab_03421 [Xenorhabdus cabanillasii JM26]CDL80212.1 conserved hypothetical protein [Xenorhabdus cabanillasii JM26]
MNQNISKEQWVKIADELHRQFCYVQFQYQGTIISIVRERASESKTHLVVYFNRKINFGWGHAESENYNPLTSLFWRSRTKSVFSKSQIADAEKQLGKRYVQRHMQKITFLTPVFPNSTPLIRQYKKIQGLALLEGNNND